MNLSLQFPLQKWNTFFHRKQSIKFYLLVKSCWCLKLRELSKRIVKISWNHKNHTSHFLRIKIFLLKYQLFEIPEAFYCLLLLFSGFVFSDISTRVATKVTNVCNLPLVDHRTSINYLVRFGSTPARTKAISGIRLDNNHSLQSCLVAWLTLLFSSRK